MLKVRLIVLLIIVTIILTGCFNYRDINRAIFITMLVIDVDDQDNIVVYAEAFHSYRSNKNNAEQGQRLVFHATGPSLFSTIRKLNVASRYKIDYTQCKVYVFTEKAAKNGIGDFLDFLRRDQEFLIRAFLAVYLGPPEELLKADIKQDEFIGIYLYELFQDRLLSSILVNYRFSDNLNARLMGKHIDKINALKIEQETVDQFVSAQGAAIFENDIMVDMLTLDETIYCNFLYDRIQSGAIEIQHPQHKDKTLTLEIRKSKTKSKMDYDGRRILMKMNIDIDVVIADAQSGLDWNKETIERIEHLAAVKIKDGTEALFAKFKEKGIDLLDVKHDVDIRYPKSNVENPVMITNLTSEVKVHVKGSTYNRGSR